MRLRTNSRPLDYWMSMNLISTARSFQFDKTSSNRTTQTKHRVHFSPYPVKYSRFWHSRSLKKYVLNYKFYIILRVVTFRSIWYSFGQHNFSKALSCTLYSRLYCCFLKQNGLFDGNAIFIDGAADKHCEKKITKCTFGIALIACNLTRDKKNVQPFRRLTLSQYSYGRRYRERRIWLQFECIR